LKENTLGRQGRGIFFKHAGNGKLSAVQKLRPPFDEIPFQGNGPEKFFLALLGTERVKEVAVSDKSERAMAL